MGRLKNIYKIFIYGILMGLIFWSAQSFYLSSGVILRSILFMILWDIIVIIHFNHKNILFSNEKIEYSNIAKLSTIAAVLLIIWVGIKIFN